MNINNTISQNYYGMNINSPAVSKFNAKSNNVFQNGTDTVCFTGLRPNKVAPDIKKAISKLPISKNLQKQLSGFMGEAGTLLAKMKVWFQNTELVDDTSSELKLMMKDFSSLAGDFADVVTGKKINTDSMAVVVNKIKELLSKLDETIPEDDAINIVSKKCFKELSEILDEAMQLKPDAGFSEVASLFKRLTGVYKELKTADPEGIKEFFQEINSVKLPKKW